MTLDTAYTWVIHQSALNKTKMSQCDFLPLSRPHRAWCVENWISNFFDFLATQGSWAWVIAWHNDSRERSVVTVQGGGCVTECAVDNAAFVVAEKDGWTFMQDAHAKNEKAGDVNLTHHLEDIFFSRILSILVLIFLSKCRLCFFVTSLLNCLLRTKKSF